MKFAKSILTGAGAVVLAGLILALLAPKAAHAIVATAVQVENTVASPVVSQNILPGTPFSMNCNVMAHICVMAPAVPAGYTFHATYFSAENLDFGGVKAPDEITVSYVSNGNVIGFTEVLAPGNSVTSTSHTVDWYIDPGTNFDVTSDVTASVNGALDTFIGTVSGYLTH
jgi:hypothetical protein